MEKRDLAGEDNELSFLCLVQRPLHSCAEPNLIKFDFGATADSDGVVASNLIREACCKQFSMRKFAF